MNTIVMNNFLLVFMVHYSYTYSGRFRFRFKFLGLVIVDPKTCLSRCVITNGG